MASTVAVGYDGAVTLPTGYNANIFSWNGEITQATTETTPFATAFRTHRGGVMGMTFNIEAQPKFDASTHAPAPDSTDTLALDRAGASTTLQVAQGCTYGGTGIISTVGVSSNIRDNSSGLTYAGMFTGTITQTWDETA